MDDRNIVLIGFMGTGKTSVGRILARKLKRHFIDTDERVEAKVHRKIDEIFEKDGQDHFRQLEKDCVREASAMNSIVITTGGGVVLDPENIQNLSRNGYLISLLAKPETIFKRVRRSTHRPLLKGSDKMVEIKRLMEERRPFYEKADLCLHTDGLSSWQVASIVLKKIKGLQA